MDINNLINKYNISIPRYTSYPTVPYWDNTSFSINQWKEQVKKTFNITNKTNGISIYIHLPYCESLCTYCGCNTRITINHQVEKPYIEAILKEWDLYLSLFEDTPIIAELHLGGGTPTFFSPQNLYYLIHQIITKATIANNAHLSFEGHPINTSFYHLQTLRQLGFSRVSFGIQDFDNNVQVAINRYQTVEQVNQVTDWARSLGYDSINYDLVYGLPFQTMEGIITTINHVIKLKPDRIAFYSYAHVPWIKHAQRKFTEADLPNHQQKLNLYLKGRELLLNAGYVDIGMDHFALPTDSLTKAFNSKTLHRNFMGYTTNNTKLLIGLGASAISDTWGAFAQNIKVVEDYLEQIKNRNFAVFKGHILTEEDKIIRKKILELICNYQTNLSDLTDKLPPVLNRLKLLELDQLITITNNSVSVLPLGKRFIRNIALAFDIRYWNNILQENLFSRAV